MPTYQPAATVLPGFTDEALSSPSSGWAPTEAAKLLTIPAEYRQPAEMEVHRRSGYDIRSRGGEVEWVATAGTSSVRSAVVAEIRAQLAKVA